MKIIQKIRNILSENREQEFLGKLFYNLDFIFIIVDGPKNMIDRLGSLQLFKNNVNLTDFVVIFDDVHKNIGRAMIEEIKQFLISENIEYDSMIIKGKKHQFVVVSKNNSFLLTI